VSSHASRTDSAIGSREGLSFVAAGRNSDKVVLAEDERSGDTDSDARAYYFRAPETPLLARFTRHGWLAGKVGRGPLGSISGY
jgi:hypothetical protein